MGVKQKDAGLDDELAITAQGVGLGSDDVRVPGEIEVVVAIEAHRVRTGRASVQQRAPLPERVPPAGELALNPPRQVIADRCCRNRCGNGDGRSVENFHDLLHVGDASH